MLKQSNPLIFLICLPVLLAVLIGCSAYREIKEPPTLPPDTEEYRHFKIGLLADSQIQTEKSSAWVPLMTGKIEDVVVPVALRPPALNHYSRNLLKYFLDELISAKVDVILYLGDAANNGCRDEIDEVLKILGEATENSIPVFFIIGNHDYLGCGNTPFMQDRQALCDSADPTLDGEANPPLTKYELMCRVDNFNKINAGISPSWTYHSNLSDHSRLYSEVKRKEMFQSCVKAFSGQSDDMPMRHQHRKPGCFLAGKAVNRDMGLELILLDTSDYSDKGIAYNVNPVGKGFFGISGWISTFEGGSQLDWFESHQEETRPDIRVVASHYQLSDLAPFFRIVLPRNGLPCRIARLFFPRPAIGNYWFSAHTHDLPKNRVFTMPGWSCPDADEDIKIHMLNIGATSDSSALSTSISESHAVVATILKDDKDKPDNPIGFDIIDTSKLGRQCRRIIDIVDTQPQWGFPDYYPVQDGAAGKTLLGICTNYGGVKWKHRDTIHAKKNLDLFTGYLKSNLSSVPGIDPDLIEVCIGREASILEAVENARGKGN